MKKLKFLRGREMLYIGTFSGDGPVMVLLKCCISPILVRKKTKKTIYNKERRNSADAALENSIKRSLTDCILIGMREIHSFERK